MQVQTSDVENILNYYGPIGDDDEFLKINSIKPYQTAFIHESYRMSHPDIETSNEQLEFLGDSILKSVIARYLCERYPDQREGFLTKIKIKIENGKMLHKFARALRFNRFLMISQQIDSQTIIDIDRGRNTTSYYEDAFESFVGAVVMDFSEKGLVYVDRFVRNVIENNIDFADIIAINDNFKDSLQRYMQKIGMPVPKYSLLSSTNGGPAYRRIFVKCIYITPELYQFISKVSSTYNQIRRYNHGGGRTPWVLGVGSGKKVVEAEQEAAKNALINLGVSLNF